MVARSWFRTFLNSLRVGGKQSYPSRGRCRAPFRPALEQFEDRVVPTAVTIPTNLTAVAGAVVTVPVNVDTLSDSAASPALLGLSGANLLVEYNPATFTVAAFDVSLGTIATNGSTANGSGYSPSVPNGWSVSTNTTTTLGVMYIGISNNSNVNITGGASGSLVIINFHVSSNAPSQLAHIDLAGAYGDVPDTSLIDGTPFTSDYAPYLNPSPQDNTVLSPTYSYSGTDPDDGLVTIGNLVDVASNDAYSVTERDIAGDPMLSLAAPGVLANDTSPAGDRIQAVQLSNTTNGALTFNADGSFSYAPNLGFRGSDSFTYQFNDLTAGNSSNVATVTINVTPRLSIPTNLSGVPGGAVVVPVNIDNPDPAGSGGLSAATLAIDFNSSVATVSSSDVQPGTVTGGWTVTAAVNRATGEIGIDLTSNTSVTSTVGGSLVNITFHIHTTALAGVFPINLVASNAPVGNAVSTQLDGASGQLQLRPNPGVSGQATVVVSAATHFAVSTPRVPSPAFQSSSR